MYVFGIDIELSFVAAGTPVEEKTHLELVGSVTLDLQMGVPPVTHFFLKAQILVADVKPSDETGFAVNNDNFAVVAVVQAEVDKTKLRGEENTILSAGGLQLF